MLFNVQTLLPLALAAIAATVAQGAPQPQQKLAHKHSEHANADPIFPDEDTPKRPRFFKLRHSNLERFCQKWNQQAQDDYAIDNGVATVKSDCVPFNTDENIVGAYVTQFRNHGGTFSQTGPLGDKLNLRFLMNSDGKQCEEVAPGFCLGKATVHPQVQLK